jgi:hypothetical protein
MQTAGAQTTNLQKSSENLASNLQPKLLHLLIPRSTVNRSARPELQRTPAGLRHSRGPFIAFVSIRGFFTAGYG